MAVTRIAMPDLVRRPAALLPLVRQRPLADRRRLLAIAGPPASGKSTLAAALAGALTREGCIAETVPMDGFHLDNRLLDSRGLRARKGAPETFDAAGFIALVRRLRSEAEVCFPIFDRGQDQAIAGAGVVTPDCEIAIVEGNYLLFDEPPWDGLAQAWDLSIWIETPREMLLQRCVERWLDHGHSPEAARARAEANDLANAARIRAARRVPDMTVVEQAGPGD